MIWSLPIRFTTHLCLIAAVAIQPITVVAPRICWRVVDEGDSVCSGCLCCEVEHPGQLCGCCNSNKDGHGSCGESAEHSPEKKDAGPTGAVLHDGDLRDEEPAVAASDAGPAASVDAAADDSLTRPSGLQSRCSCQLRSQPSNGVPRRSSGDERPERSDGVTLPYVHATTSCDLHLALRAAPFGPPGLRPHSVQHLYCVWRL